MGDYTTEQLINKLEHLSEDNELPLERRLINTAVWFHRNKDRIPPEALDKKIEFMEKSMDIMIELFALTVERMQKVESHGTSASLWLPNGISMKGDIRGFG